MRDPWDGNIETARESTTQELSSPGYDGNREYENGTYGQDDYTVRERSDESGLSDVYVLSDSEQGHSHDVIDSNGNIVESYHDYLNFIINEFELSNLTNKDSKILTKKLVRK